MNKKNLKQKYFPCLQNIITSEESKILQQKLDLSRLSPFEISIKHKNIEAYNIIKSSRNFEHYTFQETLHVSDLNLFENSLMFNLHVFFYKCKNFTKCYTEDLFFELIKNNDFKNMVKILELGYDLNKK